MFDTETRKHILISNYGIKPYFAERIISQEKAMIKQAEKEGVKEFAEEVMKTTYINAYLPITEYRKIKSDIDKLLK